jgi:hypothetical protein
MKKYEFTGETLEHKGVILKRIRRISDDLVGGWIQGENNLAHEGDCFVYHDAKVYGDAMVFGDCFVYHDVRVSGMLGSMLCLLRVSLAMLGSVGSVMLWSLVRVSARVGTVMLGSLTFPIMPRHLR